MQPAWTATGKFLVRARGPDNWQTGGLPHTPADRRSAPRLGPDNRSLGIPSAGPALALGGNQSVPRSLDRGTEHKDSGKVTVGYGEETTCTSCGTGGTAMMETLSNSVYHSRPTIMS